MAVQQASGLWRTDLQQHDLSVDGHEVVQARRPRLGSAARQAHPPGRRDYLCPRGVAGVPGRRPGDEDIQRRGGLDRPAGVVHAVRNVGSGNAAELATYVVEKGKPLIALVE
jgi:hypothetical protein